MKTRTIRNEEYRATVLKVVGRYPDGRPKECIMIHDDQSTEIKEGTEFIVGYLPTKTVRKSTS
jgi:hypothetical protein